MQTVTDPAPNQNFDPLSALLNSLIGGQHHFQPEQSNSFNNFNLPAGRNTISGPQSNSDIPNTFNVNSPLFNDPRQQNQRTNTVPVGDGNPGWLNVGTVTANQNNGPVWGQELPNAGQFPNVLNMNSPLSNQNNQMNVGSASNTRGNQASFIPNVVNIDSHIGSTSNSGGGSMNGGLQGVQNNPVASAMLGQDFSNNMQNFASNLQRSLSNMFSGKCSVT